MQNKRTKQIVMTDSARYCDQYQSIPIEYPILLDNCLDKKRMIFYLLLDAAVSFIESSMLVSRFVVTE